MRSDAQSAGDLIPGWFMALLTVTAVHFGVIAWLVDHRVQAEPPQPAIIGILVAPPEPDSIAPVRPRTALPARSSPSPPPSIETSLAERSISRGPLDAREPPLEIESEIEIPVTATSSPIAETAPAPIIPPRVDAAHLNNPAPAYPPLSRRLGEQGQVLFDVYILADGTVGEIRLKHSSGYPRLDAAAREAVQRWRYVPARQGNTAIAYWYVQPVSFSLKNSQGR